MIICHCGGGGRSALAAESLQKNGLQKRPFHGRRLQSLEGRGFAGNELDNSATTFPIAFNT